MKVLGIMCSPRKRGNTSILMDETLAGVQESGAETDLVTMADLDIKPCDGCQACHKTGQCHIKDDMQQVYPRVLAADGLVFATPVYFLSISAQAKTFIDRLYVLYRGQKLVNKVGGSIAVTTRMGHSQVLNFFNTFYAINRMVTADFVAGYGRDRGDVRRDRHALKAARELGHLMVDLAQKGFKQPEQYTDVLSRYVAAKYGIDHAPFGDRFERP